MMEDIKFQNWVDIIFRLLLIISFTIFIVKSIIIFYFYNFTLKSWNEIYAKIILFEDEHYMSKFDTDTQGWKKKISYNFKFEGVEYYNDTITKNFTNLYPTKEISNYWNKKFRVNDEILIHFNPKNPKESVLDDKFNYFDFLLIGSIYIIGFFMLF